MKSISLTDDRGRAKTIAEECRRLRDAAGISIRDLSEATGLSTRTICTIESGSSSSYKIGTLITILDYFKASMTI